MEEKLREVCKAFRIEDEFVGYEPISVGNVNKTYRVDFRLADGSPKSFLVQNVNTYAFRNPVGLMNNIDLVTEHIRRKEPGSVSLHFHHTEDRKTYLIDGKNFWRMTNFIPSLTFGATQETDVVRDAGRAFGNFQMQLSDFDISLLIETIPGFHNTRKRYASFEEAVLEDSQGRAASVRDEIDYLMSVKEKACALTDLADQGRLPLRVTHNDTKINNVLFDPKTRQALVVIDLDTVMPGLMGHDFGDAIRFAANYVDEDCPEYDKAGIDLQVFRAFAEGFLEKTASAMTEEEVRTLGLSCFALTAELAVRFLDDYLRGDLYFTLRYPEHNLVRTRAQIALSKDILKRLPEMDAIVMDCLKK